MPGTSKYTWIATAGIIAAVLMIILAVVLMVNRGKQFVETEMDVDFSVAELELNDINELEIRGVWDVRILPAGSAGQRISLNAPGEIIDDIRTQQDSRLTLPAPGGFRGFAKEMEATVYLEDLSLISVEGASSVDISGMNLDALELRLEGAAKILAEDCEFNDVRLKAEGAANVDLQNSLTYTADLRIEGAAKVSIRMDGGPISGSLDGVGKVRYTGSVSEKDFRIDGLGSFEYFD